MRTASLLGLLVLGALPATAQMRDADRERLSALDHHLGAAMRAALTAPPERDLSILVGAMAGIHQPALTDGLAGDWSCRVIKLGGPAPLVAYAPFRCRIVKTGPGEWRIRKLTGSQRLSGEIAVEPTVGPADSRIVYTGVGYVDGGPALPYADFPDAQDPLEPGQTVAQVGLLEMTGPDTARILMPAPVLESRFDVLSLTR